MVVLTTQSYLVVSDVVEKVDKEHDLLFIAAEILAILSCSDAEQTHEMRSSRCHRCCSRDRYVSR